MAATSPAVRLAAVLALLSVISLGCGGSRGATAAQGPYRGPVTVELVGVTMGPAKSNGAAWDGGGHLPAEDARALAAELGGWSPGGVGFGAVAILSRPAVQALERPDPHGFASLSTVAGQGPALLLPKVQDSFTPAWTSVRYHHVLLDGSTRLRVQLVEADAMFDDPVGVFEIGAQDMQAALQRGRVHQVKVAEQTANQVLFAGISVFRE